MIPVFILSLKTLLLQRIVSIQTLTKKITQRAATWLVSFNPTKTESIIISRKLNRNRHPSIYMQNHHWTWHQHINYIEEIAWFRINVMRKLKIKLDRKSLETIFIAFIRPLLEYGDVIWDKCTQYEKKKRIGQTTK